MSGRNIPFVQERNLKTSISRISVAALVATCAISARGQENPESYSIQIQMDRVSVLAGDRAFGLIMIDSLADLVEKHNAHWAINVYTVERGKLAKVSKNPEQMQNRGFWVNPTRAADVGREIAKYQFVTVFSPMDAEFDKLNPRSVNLQVFAKLVIDNTEIVSEMPSLTTGAPFATHSFRRAMRTKAGDLSARELRQYFQQRNRPKATLASFQIDVPNWLYGSAESQYVLNSVHPESTWHRTQLLVNYINNQPDQHVDQIRAVLDSCGPAERAFNGRRLRSILGDNPPPALEAIVSEFSQVMIQL